MLLAVLVREIPREDPSALMHPADYECLRSRSSLRGSQCDPLPRSRLRTDFTVLKPMTVENKCLVLRAAPFGTAVPNSIGPVPFAFPQSHPADARHAGFCAALQMTQSLKGISNRKPVLKIPAAITAASGVLPPMDL